MARGINKVILVGNLGKDPEIRYTANGAAVANVTLATTDSWKDKQTGEKQERTEWHRVVFFSRLAEIVGEYLKKGSQIYVEGRLQTRKWQDQSGQDRYTTEIVGNDMQMLGSKGGGAPPHGDEDYDQSAPANNFEGKPATEKSATEKSATAAPAATKPANVADDFDDDIPF